MTYPDAIAYLESLIDYERRPTPTPARDFNLARMERMLAALGRPDRRLAILHIAGTKGKGSTSVMAASMLAAAGLRVGLYTSPHLVTFRERIRISVGATRRVAPTLRMIGESEVCSTLERILPVLQAEKRGPHGPPSFFEAYTALAVAYFADQVNLVVLETGLGGRLDATNAAAPAVCGITPIGLDHTRELGPTLSSVAAEKAGIIKSGVPVVSAPQQPEVLQVLERVCRERNAPLWRVEGAGTGNRRPATGNRGRRVERGGTGNRQPATGNRGWRVESGECSERPRLDGTIGITVRSSDLQGISFDLDGAVGRLPDLRCPLLGEHQALNAAVAVSMVRLLRDKGISVPEEAIRRGLAGVEWPGRLQLVSGEPAVALDGAHDPLSARALREALRSLFPGRRIGLVVGMSWDKDAANFAAELGPAAHFAICTAADSPRAMEPSALTAGFSPFCGIETAPDCRSALDRARSLAGPGGLVVVTGSLYLVGEAWQLLERASNGLTVTHLPGCCQIRNDRRRGWAAPSAVQDRQARQAGEPRPRVEIS